MPLWGVCSWGKFEYQERRRQIACMYVVVWVCGYRKEDNVLLREDEKR